MPPKNPLDPVIFFSASWIRASPFASLSAIFTKFFDNDLLFYFFNFLREIVSYTPKEKWSICEETLANCLKRKLQTVWESLVMVSPSGQYTKGSGLWKARPKTVWKSLQIEKGTWLDNYPTRWKLRREDFFHFFWYFYYTHTFFDIIWL